MQSVSRLQPILHAALACACLALLAIAGTASAEGGSASPVGSGGTAFVPPPPPPERAMIVNGKAVAPASAPDRVRRVITAANRLVGKPYRYGGGHRAYSSSRSLDRGYDCSGSVSYALYGGRFLRSPLPSGALMSWGRTGPGSWITVYAHASHAYVVVAGLRFDTSMRDDPTRTGPGWSKRLRKNAAFTPRHPRGY
jgi:hypothetical protein